MHFEARAACREAASPQLLCREPCCHTVSGAALDPCATPEEVRSTGWECRSSRTRRRPAQSCVSRRHHSAEAGHSPATLDVRTAAHYLQLYSESYVCRGSGDWRCWIHPGNWASNREGVLHSDRFGWTFRDPCRY